MAHVNLLPWRESLRKQQKQNYLALLLGVALSVLGVAYAVGMFIDALIDNQNRRNNYLQQEITILDAQIAQIRDIREQKEAIEKRMALIEQLQTSRNVAPIILDELVKVVPPGISFRNLSRTANQMEVTGVSESNNRLANFMRNLQESKVFIDSELSSIVADTSASDAVSDFKLTFRISPTVAPEFVDAEADAK